MGTSDAASGFVTGGAVGGVGALARLLLHGGARVEALDQRPEVARRLHRREAGNAATDHQNLGGGDLAGGRHLGREHAAEGVGSLDDGAVAGDVGHRGEDIACLGLGERARDAVEAERGHLLGRQLGDEVLVLRRLEDANQAAVKEKIWLSDKTLNILGLGSQ